MQRVTVSRSVSKPLNDLPQVMPEHFRVPDPSRLLRPHSAHRPRILLLYGSLHPRSFSRLLVGEAARLLKVMGEETRVFDPSGLPLPGDAPDAHPKVQELRELALWSEGMNLPKPAILKAPSMTGDHAVPSAHNENGTFEKDLTWNSCWNC